VIAYDVGGSGQRLILKSPAIKHLEAHRQLTPRHREAGGQLFATFSDDSIIIEEATGPRWRDKRTRTSYRPDRKAEQQEILEHHCRGLHYVGDWHTHPSPRPSPSYLDYRSIEDSFRHSEHELAGFVLIVVGTLGAPDGLHVSVSNGDRAFTLGVSVIGPTAFANPTRKDQ
jgi:integrative and conjugative element protein (TIGR02256 family)